VKYKNFEKCERLKKGILSKEFITSFCENNCFYCAFRKDRNFKREFIQPEKLAKSFFEKYRKGYARGIFISSAILKSSDETQYLINKSAIILRKKYGYRGYMHIKIMPDTDYFAIKEALLYADRASVNFEAPGDSYLKKLSKDKDFKKIFDTVLKMRRAYFELRGKYPFILPYGICTQFIYSPLSERDRDYLEFTEFLYRKINLKMVYFSRFTPVQRTPFESLKQVSLLREKRIYQASLLIRDYGFSLNDIPLDENGNLIKNKDPKLVYAEKNYHLFPVDIKKASYEILLRIPGIGPKIAKKIIQNRDDINLYNLDKLGINLKRAGRFILVSGKSPLKQASLF